MDCQMAEQLPARLAGFICSVRPTQVNHFETLAVSIGNEQTRFLPIVGESAPQGEDPTLQQRGPVESLCPGEHVEEIRLVVYVCSREHHVLLLITGELVNRLPELLPEKPALLQLEITNVLLHSEIILPMIWRVEPFRQFVRQPVKIISSAGCEGIRCRLEQIRPFFTLAGSMDYRAGVRYAVRFSRSSLERRPTVEGTAVLKVVQEQNVLAADCP